MIPRRRRIPLSAGYRVSKEANQTGRETTPAKRLVQIKTANPPPQVIARPQRPAKGRLAESSANCRIPLRQGRQKGDLQGSDRRTTQVSPCPEGQRPRSSRPRASATDCSVRRTSSVTGLAFFPLGDRASGNDAQALCRPRKLLRSPPAKLQQQPLQEDPLVELLRAHANIRFHNKPQRLSHVIRLKSLGCLQDRLRPFLFHF